MTTFQLGQLVHSSEVSDSLRLYVYEADGKHRGGIYFRRNPKFPDEEITAEAARKLVDRAILDGKEVRVTNSGDFLVFHFKDGSLVHPETVGGFWGKVFA